MAAPDRDGTIAKLRLTMPPTTSYSLCRVPCLRLRKHAVAMPNRHVHASVDMAPTAHDSEIVAVLPPVYFTSLIRASACSIMISPAPLARCVPDSGS